MDQAEEFISETECSQVITLLECMRLADQFATVSALAEKGDAKAQYHVGLCLLHGINADKNTAKAADWFRKAAEQGHVSAQYQLGLCFEQGIGVAKNVKTALEWFHRAAGHDHASSQCQLGLVCVRQLADTRQATEWFLKSARQGNVAAQFNVALGFEKGRGREAGDGMVSKSRGTRK